MKRLAILLCLLVIVPAFLFSQDLGPWKAAYGDWKMVSGRLQQLSTKAGMAQAYMRLPQSGIMQYEFDVKYIDGFQDMYAGFGVHLGIDSACPGKSWGNGKSYLLWLTLDPKAYAGSGVFAQAYKSDSHSVMYLMHRGNQYQIPTSILSAVDMSKMTMYTLPIKIRVDYSTGWVKIWDPTVQNYYYKFSLGGPIRNGMYVSVRTNSMAASFGDFTITQLDTF
jgi:hypothetical protein